MRRRDVAGLHMALCRGHRMPVFNPGLGDRLAVQMF